MHDYIGKNGYRRHLSIAFGKTAAVVQGALENYLGYQLKVF